MFIEQNVPLQPFNSFGIAAKAHALVRIQTDADLTALFQSGLLDRQSPLILGGGSNLVLTQDVQAPVLKMEMKGRHLVHENDQFWVVEAAAGENWHEFVTWTLDEGYFGLENLALIPGTVGASPVQNIGAYGMELQDRFEALDAFDLKTGRIFSLNSAQCAFGYRDSIFKHTASQSTDLGLQHRAVITRVRFRLPKTWRPEFSYLDLARKAQDLGLAQPSARQIFDWVCEIRRHKLPDPAVIGNAGSFFKNPIVSEFQCADIIGRDPHLVHYALPDGRFKLAAGWLIDACGWRGKTIGHAGVHDRQALVLVNRGTPATPVTGGEVMTLAKAIQTSVYERFGILLETEPVVV